MKLTDNEKRDIIKCIEADRDLPDKYRFLLFEEKQWWRWEYEPV